MILLRALNDFDLANIPEKNGIASKKLISDLTSIYLKKTNSNIKYDKLRVKDRAPYMIDYLNNNNDKLAKLYRKSQIQISNMLGRFVNEKDNESYFKILYYLSSLPNHVMNGTISHTEWISTTCNFDCIWDYYDGQNEHKVAVIKTNTNGVFNENTFVVDLSNEEIIEKIKFLCRRINFKSFDDFLKLCTENQGYNEELRKYFHAYMMKKISENSIITNRTKKNNEILIANYISPSEIESILEALQVDLVRANRLNTDFLLKQKKEQKIELEKLKYKLKELLLIENNPYLLHVFDELYIKNKNIKKITKNNTDEENKMNNASINIISKALIIPSPILKR